MEQDGFKLGGSIHIKAAADYIEKCLVFVGFHASFRLYDALPNLFVFV